MTADIKYLEKLGHNAPAPKMEKPLRLFIYKSRGRCRQIEKYSDFNVYPVRWDVISALTSSCDELIWAALWLELHEEDTRVKRGFENYRYSLSQIKHPDRDEHCWVTGVSYGLQRVKSDPFKPNRKLYEDSNWYYASSVHLRKPMGFWAPKLVSIRVNGLACWNSSDGFVEEFEGVNQPGWLDWLNEERP